MRNEIARLLTGAQHILLTARAYAADDEGDAGPLAERIQEAIMNIEAAREMATSEVVTA